MKNIRELEALVWHRFVKVCYVMAYGICLLIVVLLARERWERGSYGEAGQAFLLGLVTVVLIGDLIRRSYLYIVAGIPFFSGLALVGQRRVRLSLLVTESWGGQRPLYQIFWLYHVVGSFLLLAPIYFFDLLTDYQQSATFNWLSGLLFYGYILSLIGWETWTLGSIWHCAPNSSIPSWKFLARGYVLLFVVTISFDLSREFNAYLNRGYEGQVKAALRNAALAEESYFAENSKYKAGALVNGTLPDLSETVDVRITAKTGPSTFILVASHSSCGSATWIFSGDTGMITGGPCH